MKKKILETAVAKAAYKTAEESNNFICSFIFYQPEIPEAVKRLKKKNDKQDF